MSTVAVLYFPRRSRVLRRLSWETDIDCGVVFASLEAAQHRAEVCTAPLKWRTLLKEGGGIVLLERWTARAKDDTPLWMIVRLEVEEEES